MLTAANTALEQARTEAEKQQFYIERVVEPNLPDLPLLPGSAKASASYFRFFGLPLLHWLDDRGRRP